MHHKNNDFHLSVQCSINLDVKDGELLGIIGKVGMGKSSLLSAAIGEMTNSSGSVAVKVMSGSVLLYIHYLLLRLDFSYILMNALLVYVRSHSQ